MTLPLAFLAWQDRTSERLLLVAISGPDAAFGYTLLVLKQTGEQGSPVGVLGLCVLRRYLDLISRLH